MSNLSNLSMRNLLSAHRPKRRQPSPVITGGYVFYRTPRLGKEAIMSTIQSEKLAWRIGEFARASGVSQSLLYKHIREGKLRAVKQGRSTLILDSDAKAYLTALPEIPASLAA